MKGKTKEVISIGCDPEFLCAINGQFQPAHNFFENRGGADEIGVDGCSSVGELRPGHSPSPLDIVTKIRLDLQKIYDEYPELQLYSGHHKFNYPIGGHIHIGATYVKSNPKAIDNIDCLLWTLSDVLDDLSERDTRLKTGYGKRKALDQKPYGIEYRSPGSWLHSPAVALVNLAVAGIAAYNPHINFAYYSSIMYNKKRFLNHLSKLPGIIIPEDYAYPLTVLSGLLAKRNKINWKQDIFTNWGIGDKV